MNNELANQVCVVTGASTGIGRGIALAVARAGADVVIHGRRPSDKLESLRQQIREHGRRCEAVYGDFSESPRYEQLVESAWATFGEVNHWVNNAGGDVLTGELAETSFAEKLDYLWKTDVVSSLMLSRLAGKRMLQRGQESIDESSSIINLGWDQAAQGMAGDSGEMFATTKGAIMAMTRSLAQSLAPRVRVNCLAPGWIQTKWGNQASSSWDRRAKDDSLMGRWGAPDDVAKAATFLCAHPFISGHCLPVNGGFRYGKE